MNKFTYVSHKDPYLPEILFIWEGESILYADIAFTEKTGIDVLKNPYIGVTIEKR